MTWQTLTPLSLEREYSPSSKVADYAACIAAYRSGSAEVERRHTVEIVRYGPAIDAIAGVVWAPAAVALHVFIHGGYWQELGWRDSLFAASGVVEAGQCFAAVNYTLAPEATLQEIIAQCDRSLAALVAAFEVRFGVRPFVVVSGSSAGAYLAATAALSTCGPQGTATWSPDIVILLSGIYDLEPLLHTTVNAKLRLSLDEAIELSLHRERPGRVCPAIISWGEHETDEFKRQSIEFARWWERGNDQTWSFEVPGRNHFDLPFDLGDRFSQIGALVERLVSARAPLKPARMGIG